LQRFMQRHVWPLQRGNGALHVMGGKGLVESAAIKPFLVAKIIADGRYVDASSLGDRAGGCAGKALLGKQAHRLAQQALPRGRPVAPAQPGLF
jgi:hypothetical protein